MKKYVICVAVHSGHVVLIKKKRPSWQAGFLNFPGGKVEKIEVPVNDTWHPEDETDREAARREFMEETGVATYESDWKYIGLLSGKDYTVAILMTEGPHVMDVESKTDEDVMIIPIDDLGNHPHIHNVPIILKFALTDAKDGCFMTLKYP